jgi:hypothetical protein
MPAKRIDELLNPGSDDDLGKLVRRALNMGNLAQILRKSLPKDLAPGLHAVNLHNDGVLVVLATTPAWAARLRFEAGTMLEAVRAAGADVTSCKVRVGRG